MFKNIKTFFTALALTCLGLGAAPVFATALPTTTFNFVGNCEDCAQALQQGAYEVTGSLVLQGYSVGNGSFGNANFMSFSYGGSNLVSAFTWTPGNVSFVDGYFGGNAQNLDHYVNIVTNTTVLEDQSSVFSYFTSFRPEDSGYRFVLGTVTTPPCIDDPDNGFVCKPDDFVRDYGTSNWSTNAPQPVPEPGSLLLVGAAMMALGLARRRKA